MTKALRIHTLIAGSALIALTPSGALADMRMGAAINHTPPQRLADNFTPSELSVGIAYLRQREFDLAYAKFSELALKGNAAAMREIGWMHASGKGRPADPALALGWFERAAEAGDAPAMLLVGTIFARGISVPADREKAVYWLGKASKSSNLQVRGSAADELRRI